MKRSGIEERLQEVAEDFTFSTMVTNALSLAIFKDYCQVIAKLEGSTPDKVRHRISQQMHENLHDKGWYVYHKQTDQGDIPALGMRWNEQAVRVMPVPVLQMPDEVPGNPKPIKKKRKSYKG